MTTERQPRTSILLLQVGPVRIKLSICLGGNPSAAESLPDREPLDLTQREQDVLRVAEPGAVEHDLHFLASLCAIGRDRPQAGRGGVERRRREQDQRQSRRKLDSK